TKQHGASHADSATESSQSFVTPITGGSAASSQNIATESSTDVTKDMSTFANANTAHEDTSIDTSKTVGSDTATTNAAATQTSASRPPQAAASATMDSASHEVNGARVAKEEAAAASASQTRAFTNLQGKGSSHFVLQVNMTAASDKLV